jgi:hypothetical protein
MYDEKFECVCGFKTINWNEWNDHKEFGCES